MARDNELKVIHVTCQHPGPHPCIFRGGELLFIYAQGFHPVFIYQADKIDART